VKPKRKSQRKFERRRVPWHFHYIYDTYDKSWRKLSTTPSLLKDTYKNFSPNARVVWCYVRRSVIYHNWVFNLQYFARCQWTVLSWRSSLVSRWSSASARTEYNTMYVSTGPSLLKDTYNKSSPNARVFFVSASNSNLPKLRDVPTMLRHLPMNITVFKLNIRIW